MLKYASFPKRGISKESLVWRVLSVTSSGITHEHLLMHKRCLILFYAKARGEVNN